jgi:hypothetical protein
VMGVRDMRIRRELEADSEHDGEGQDYEVRDEIERQAAEYRRLLPYK